ncbi:MAG TPA: hypothetical protein PLD02_14195, partial [Saprospiraceae bacterium]|nr:hypothetical protein [Saprospiraceae bacterium]
MKNFLCSLVVFTVIILNFNTLKAQCTYGGVAESATTYAVTTSFTFVSTTGGKYIKYSVTRGRYYNFSTLAADGSDATFDSQLTLYDNNGNLLGIHNDDNSSTSQSKLFWVATYSGTVRVLVSAFPCATNATNIKVMAAYVNWTAPPTCENTIYASSSGTNSNATQNTPNTPHDLLSAISIAQQYSAQIAYIKLLSGTYTINQSLPVLPSVTYDGKYEVANDGCTGTNNIFRKNSALTTQITTAISSVTTTSASCMAGSVVAPYVMGMVADASSSWTLRDINDSVSAANTSNYGGGGCTLYGLYANNTSTFKIERCGIGTGTAPNGAAGAAGGNGAGGGGAFYGGDGGCDYYTGCGFAPGGGGGSGGSGGAGGTGANGAGNIVGANGSGGSGGSGGAGGVGGPGKCAGSNVNAAGQAAGAAGGNGGTGTTGNGGAGGAGATTGSSP